LTDCSIPWAATPKQTYHKPLRLKRLLSHQPSEGGSGPEPEPDLNDLGIEDSVIRELARSLRPQHR
jgi:hypothetical protein